MPLDTSAIQTTATNSATYLVNKRRRVFVMGALAASCCGASVAATPPGSLEARNPLRKSGTFIDDRRTKVGSSCPSCREPPSLFDDLIGERNHCWRHRQAERRRGLEIDGKFIFGGRLRRKFGGVGPLQDAIDIRSRAPEDVRRFRPVRHQAALLNELSIRIGRGDPVLRRRLHD